MSYSYAASPITIAEPAIKNIDVTFTGGDVVGWAEKSVDEKICRISKVIAGPAKAEFNFHRVRADFSGTGTLYVSIGYSTSDNVDEMIEKNHLRSAFQRLENGKEISVTSPYKGQCFAWVIIQMKGEVRLRQIKYGCSQFMDTLYGHVPGTFEFAGGKLPYRLMYPKNYDPKKSYPLVISVSGSGGVGTDNHRSMEMITLARYLFTKYYHVKEFECFSLVPQIPSNEAIPNMFWPKGKIGGPTKYHPDWPAVNTKGWYTRTCIRLIKELVLSDAINIDRKRIYMTGFSYGGKACWEFLKAEPNLFAAAASGGGWPIGGAYSNPNAEMKEQLKSEAAHFKHIPVFIFAGEKDPMRFGSKVINDIILSQGGETRFRIYQGSSHVSAASKGWTDIKNIRWIFSHQKKKHSNRIKFRSEC